jgi:hypothetical protein
MTPYYFSKLDFLRLYDQRCKTQAFKIFNCDQFSENECHAHDLHCSWTPETKECKIRHSPCSPDRDKEGQKRYFQHLYWVSTYEEASKLVFLERAMKTNPCVALYNKLQDNELFRKDVQSRIMAGEEFMEDVYALRTATASVTHMEPSSKEPNLLEMAVFLADVGAAKPLLDQFHHRALWQSAFADDVAQCQFTADDYGQDDFRNLVRNAYQLCMGSVQVVAKFAMNLVKGVLTHYSSFHEYALFAVMLVSILIISIQWCDYFGLPMPIHATSYASTFLLLHLRNIYCYILKPLLKFYISNKLGDVFHKLIGQCQSIKVFGTNALEVISTHFPSYWYVSVYVLMDSFIMQCDKEWRLVEESKNPQVYFKMKDADGKDQNIFKLPTKQYFRLLLIGDYEKFGEETRLLFCTNQFATILRKMVNVSLGTTTYTARFLNTWLFYGDPTKLFFDYILGCNKVIDVAQEQTQEQQTQQGDTGKASLNANTTAEIDNEVRYVLHSFSYDKTNKPPSLTMYFNAISKKVGEINGDEERNKTSYFEYCNIMFTAFGTILTGMMDPTSFIHLATPPSNLDIYQKTAYEYMTVLKLIFLGPYYKPQAETFIPESIGDVTQKTLNTMENFVIAGWLGIIQVSSVGIMSLVPLPLQPIIAFPIQFGKFSYLIFNIVNSYYFVLQAFLLGIAKVIYLSNTEKAAALSLQNEQVEAPVPRQWWRKPWSSQTKSSQKKSSQKKSSSSKKKASQTKSSQTKSPQTKSPRIKKKRSRRTQAQILIDENRLKEESDRRRRRS